MNEVEVLTLKIKKYKKKLNDLINERMEICPHSNVHRSCYCDDDEAYSKEYTYIFECLDCGEYEESEDPNYEM